MIENIQLFIGQNSYITIAYTIIVSYLIGTISPSYLIGLKVKNIDIRNFGSGNAGTTNTLRVMGKKIAALVLFIDFFKGFIVVFMVRRYFGMNLALLSMIAVVLGHIYPIFLGFKGGKGVATSFGALYCLFIKEILICSAIGLMILYLKRYVSLAALITLFLINVMLIIFNNPLYYLWFTMCIFFIITYKHKENIKRLINHNERKIGEK